MNVVATDTGTLVEVQGTGEGATFPRSTLDKMLDVALARCEQLFELQRAALESRIPGVLPEPVELAEEGVRKLTRRLLVASRNAKKLGRAAPGARRRGGRRGLTLRRTRRRARVRRGARDGRDVRGQRAGQGPRRGRARPGCASCRRRFRARGRRAQRDAGGAVGALVGPPRRRPREHRAAARLSSPTSPTSGAVRRSCRACALVVPGGGEVVVRGEWPGGMAPTPPRGDGGFGYDPVFVPDGDDAHAAELTPAGEGRPRRTAAARWRCWCRR